MVSGNLVRFLPMTSDGTYMSTKIECGSYGTVIEEYNKLSNSMKWVRVMFNIGIYDIRLEDLRDVNDG